jgi:alpha-galactosidase
MDEQTRSVLTNKEVIAIDQDVLGIEGFKYSDKDSVQTWFKPLSDGDWAVCFVNRSSIAKPIEFNWQNEVVKDELSKRGLHADAITYKLRDLWTKKDAGATKKLLKAVVQPHDVLLLRLIK